MRYVEKLVVGYMFELKRCEKRKKIFFKYFYLLFLSYISLLTLHKYRLIQVKC